MKLPLIKPFLLAIAFSILHWFGTQTLYAQRITTFSNEIGTYPLEVEKLISGQLGKDEESLIREFSLFWNSDTLTIEQKDQIILISNHLLKKMVVSTRHFITYIKILKLYQQQAKFQEQINIWLNGLEDYTKSERVSITQINQFLENSYALFTRGAFAINPAFEWKGAKKNFKFEFNETLTINFTNENLICTNQTDSIAIINTNGRYYPFDNKWVGKGGKVTWVRSQFPVDEIYATLNHYIINTSRNEYEADSVYFTNLDYFTEPSLGKLKDKVARASRPENVVYPEFHAYDQRHKILNLFNGINFDGGYYMLGSQFIGSGTRENPAIIEILRNNQDFLMVKSRTFIFKRQTVISDNASVRFKIETDSLYHNGLGFSYNDNSRIVNIAPTNLLTTQSPVLSSYHNFSITFGQIQWRLGQDEIVFSAPIGSSQSRALFESNNYFNELEFDQLMGRDDQHPLFAVANYTRSIQSREFNVDRFAQFIRKTHEQTRNQILRLAMMGYLLYEYETGEVRALPKLYDAIRARSKYIDYDLLKFYSNVQSGANATLNLNTLEMAIRGVENVSVSDHQNVFLFPANRELILKKDRNFAFDGVVKAGLFTFYGKDFNFDYGNFNILSSGIDSLNLDYQTEDIDFYGKRILKSVTSTLEVISGEIHIDKPNNKSGLELNTEYPIFKSTDKSFVFYDDASIFKGVYKRDNFYFAIDPFTFFGINNFEYSDMNFTGTFFSADIFAPISDTLILRPDNSLGFRKVFPSEGFPVFQGKGKFFNRIDLSNRGLRGNGAVHYITASTASDNFIFFPDSMNTRSTEFSIARQDAGIQYPEVIGKVHNIRWHPYKDQLHIHQGSEPFVMFGNQAKLIGNLRLEPLGLMGNGLLNLENAQLQSKQYNFNAIDIRSDLASAQFDIVSNKEIGFIAKQVKAWINFDSRTGEFNKVNESIFADLPPMMYHSHLDMFIWAMDRNELTILTPGILRAHEMEKFYVPGMPKSDSIPPGALFYSLHRNEDSLYFFSSKARYNLNQPGIIADSVKSLQIADAFIYPNKQKIEVDAKRRMMPISESRITANYLNKFHQFYNANITIAGRKQYTASGTVDYVDQNKRIQPIKIKEIKVDSRGNTFAQSSVTEPDSFKLSSEFSFIGDFEIFAQNEYWTFNGGARPIHTCPQIRSSNLQFKAQIDPHNIFIPVPQQPRNINQNFLLTGSVVTIDSIHLYPALISSRKEYSDKVLIASEGYLHYNKNRGRFMIGSKEKIFNQDTIGNLISLSKDLCMLFSEGIVNLPINLGQINHSTSGNLAHILSDSTLTMDLVLSLDFHFNQQSLEVMANDILEQPGLTRTDQSRLVFRKYLKQKLAPRDAQAALNQINLFGAMTQLPRSLENTINFSELRLRWDHKNTSFVSYGKIGIGSIAGIHVNKKVDGFVEILKRNTGDWMMIYLELSPEKYYVFYYVRGSLQVSSHNPLFTDPINDMKTKDRRVKVKPGQIPYNFVVGTRRELQRTRERYNQLLGIASETTDIDDEEELDGEEEKKEVEEELNQGEEEKIVKEEEIVKEEKEEKEEGDTLSLMPGYKI